MMINIIQTFSKIEGDFKHDNQKDPCKDWCKCLSVESRSLSDSRVSKGCCNKGSREIRIPLSISPSNPLLARGHIELWFARHLGLGREPKRDAHNLTSNLTLFSSSIPFPELPTTKVKKGKKFDPSKFKSLSWNCTAHGLRFRQNVLVFVLLALMAEGLFPSPSICRTCRSSFIKYL